MTKDIPPGSGLDIALAHGPMTPPPCPKLHVDNMPGIYEEPRIGPCCAHCGADLGVPGPRSGVSPQ